MHISNELVAVLVLNPILLTSVFVIDKVFALLVPQSLPAVTETVPVGPVVVVMEIVPCPDNIIHPGGTLHVYVVAFDTAVIEYVASIGAHKLAVPVMVPGVVGVINTEAITAILVADLHPVIVFL